MKNDQKIISGVINVLACLVLFICLGFMVMGGSGSDAVSGQYAEILHFWNRYGIAGIFCLTLLLLVFLVIKQRALIKIQKKDSRADTKISLRSLERIDPDYQQLLNVAPIGIIQTDYQGRLLFANPAAVQISGFMSAEDFKNVVNSRPGGLQDFYVSQSRRKELLQKLYRERQTWVASCEKFFRKDGSIFDAAIQLSLRHDASKGEEFIVGFFEDVTERVENERRLQHQVGVEHLLNGVSHRLAVSRLVDARDDIQNSLKEIRSFFGADCAYICLLDEQAKVECLYSSSDGQADERCRKFVGQFFLFGLSWWENIFRVHKDPAFFQESDVSEKIPEPMRVYKKFDIQNVAVAPIFDAQKFAGFIGMNFRGKQPQWNTEDMSPLKICGEIFYNAFKKGSMQEKLVKAKERVDLAFREGYLGMYDWDLPTGEVFFNDIWFRMLGYSPYALKHTIETWKELIHPDDKERVLKALDEYLYGSSPLYYQEFRLKTKTGGWKWIQNQGRVVKRDQEGRPVRMLGLHRDITELRLRTRELARHQDMFQFLVENMPVGFFVKDIQDDYRVVIWNQSMSGMFGVYRDEALGKNIDDFFDKRTAEMCSREDQEIIKTKEARKFDPERVMVSGEEKWIQRTSVPILDENHNPVFLLEILEDLTGHHQMEDQLRHAQKMQSVGQLAAGIAHEVKNPLGIILLAAEGLLVNKSLAKAEEKITNKIHMIKRSALQANSVILELLKFSRFSNEGLECIDIHKVIENAVLLSRNRDKDKGIRFVTEFYSEALTCLGGEVLLEQVFVNLFNNAVDAIESEGEICVRTRISADKESIVIEVRDNGRGIPEEVLPKIFDPFFTTKAEGKGTGLGLSTIFMIVERYKGFLSVDSSIGKGTTFTIKFPHAENSEQN